MLSTGIGEHLWYSLNFICCQISYAAAVHVHSWSAWSIIITAIALVLPNRNHKACEVYFFFGTLAFALAAGASAAGAGGLAPLFGAGAPLVGGLGAPEAAPPVVGAPVLTAFFAAAIVYYLHERRSMSEDVVVVVEWSTSRQSFIALPQPCPHLRQSSYRFSLWIANYAAAFSSGTIDVQDEFGLCQFRIFSRHLRSDLFVAVPMISTGGKIQRK
ncbi:hypothetical protein DFJ58DRAFT_767504 [Suillus subalutaceus]|uniref:uncharacterized protein n=1 Tax=Suillus subalutaceus TaxID=48586 RepID=UPI001B876324|nr:uncharacterized protein DFJ58DRAFT_767504 [Suillus subalutaceus]KAG1868344.1 hypothetical protein DFJ58DRAFT_767504 [Suillus subalutaceus]